MAVRGVPPNLRRALLEPTPLLNAEILGGEPTSLLDRALAARASEGAQGGPGAAPEGPGGFRGGLQRIFSGVDDPRLTPEQNAEARKTALILGGLQTMVAANQPGARAGSSLAQGIAAGQQAGASARSGLYDKNQQARVQAFLSDPEMTAQLGLNPQQVAALQVMNPLQAAEQISALAFAKQPAPFAVAAGSGVFDPSTGGIVETQPAKPETLPSDLRTAMALNGIQDINQATPGEIAAVGETLKAIRALGGTRVQIDTGEKVELGLTSAAVERFNTTQDRALTAESRLGSLEAMTQMLDSGMVTGGVEAMTLPLRQVASSFGLADADQLSQQEAFNGLANKLALEMKEGMTGQMSDRDIKFLQAQAPQLQNSVEGNRLMIEILRRVANRQIEIADFEEDYYAANPKLTGLRRARSRWVRDNPLFTDLVGDPFAGGPTGGG
jgi:hypothetical protein